MEGDAGHGEAVRFEDVARRGFGEPVGWVLGAAREGGGRGVVDLGLKEVVAGFEVEDLFLLEYVSWLHTSKVGARC